MTKLRPLTRAENNAIRAYAMEHGRYWKASLRDDWMNARTTGVMQALRNSHGPSWLVSFSLTRDQSSASPIRAISVTADNGDIFEATMMGADEPWMIAYPEGQDRFYGSEREVRAHIRQLILYGANAKVTP
ncbi:MAG: hypothetical protein DI607_00645 [Sphingomonas hengshuiensis]|nr:MAG: hypothetical protein DI607_00645 [Sphingomonas hengshuiensis]